ncbi:MAG: diguanylate cyclase, partial [Desulfobacteraceae bacterium]|nr:diguanylate cyclase [Desulfobacteraceae bacterium]
FFLIAAFLISIHYLKKQKNEIEITLGQTKDQLSKAFHSKAVFMSISTLDEGRIINVNETFLKGMGFTKEEVIGKTSLELSIYPDTDQRQLLVNSIKENGFLKDFDITLQTKEKKIIPASISCDLILLQEMQCVLSVMIDITERKNLEEELKKAMFTANQMTADAEIKNYQLEMEMGQRHHAEKVNKTLYNISNSVNATSNLDELYKSIHKIMGRLWNLSNFYIAVYFKEKDSLMFPYWVDEKDKTFESVPDISDKDSLTIDVIKSGKPTFITKKDLLEGGKHHGKNYAGSLPQVWLGVPLKIKGDVIGVMATQSYTDPQSFTKDDINIMMTVSDQVAHAIEQKRSEQAIRISEKKHRSIIESIEDGYCETDMAGNILFFNDAMCKITGYPRQELLGKNYTNFLEEKDQKEIKASQFFTDAPEKRLSEFSYKIIQKNGSEKHIGALPSLIKDSEEQPIGFRSIIRDIESQKKYEENLLFLAYHDALTGLKNRKAFYENLARCLKSARRHNNKVAILYMDIDKFKKVNDTLGHEIGDELLMEISQRLNNCMRQTDVISRIGGDEFIIIIDDPKHFNPEKAAAKILTALSRSYHLSGHEISYISTSIGIGIFPDDAGQIEDLVKKADQAMYGAKEKRNKVVFFSDIKKLSNFP